jgi:hypothetical protein
MFYLVVAGGSLYKVSTGGVATALTLPSGVTIDPTKRARMAVMNRFIAVVNAPTQNLLYSATEDKVYPLTPLPPLAPQLSTPNTGTLSGNYRVRVSFIIKDPAGRVIAESPLGTESQDSGTFTNKKLKVTAIPRSSQPEVTGRRLYRTSTGPGSVYYHWIDLDDNIQTEFEGDESDASLALLPAPKLGLAPGAARGGALELIVQWRNRFWGKSSLEPDVVYYTEEHLPYAWTGRIVVPRLGDDERGVTAFLPRRDELGIAKRDALWKVVGSSESDFALVQVLEGAGCLSQETVVVVRDIAYWLGEKGVWAWSADGAKLVSLDRAHAWFATDLYFNRSRFDRAFAHYNPRTDSYELFLASAGSSVEDRWVSFYPRGERWLGPHKTRAFTPTAAATMEDASDVDQPFVGTADGFLYVGNRSTYRDDTQAIEFRVKTKAHSGNAPDIFHHWGQPAIINRVEPAGTMSVIPYVGQLNAAAGTPFTVALTEMRHTDLPRLGEGELCQLEFVKDTVDEAVAIYGYELPFHELGRR